jgi:flagellar hook assembly protein FlgD
VIEVFNPTGRKIRTLVEGDRPAGEYTVVWDGANDAGRRVGSGIYICRMTAGRFSKSMKMTVMK